MLPAQLLTNENLIIAIKVVKMKLKDKITCSFPTTENLRQHTLNLKQNKKICNYSGITKKANHKDKPTKIDSK